MTNVGRMAITVFSRRNSDMVGCTTPLRPTAPNTGSSWSQMKCSRPMKILERKSSVIQYVSHAPMHFLQLFLGRKNEHGTMGLDHTANPIRKLGGDRSPKLQGKLGFARAAVATHDAGFADRNPVMCDPAPLLDRHAFPLRSVEGLERQDLRRLSSLAGRAAGVRSRRRQNLR